MRVSLAYLSSQKLSPIKDFYAMVHGMLVQYPTPTNLNYLWNFGSLSGILLVIQIVTGLFLSMYYSAHIELAFLNIDHIMRDVDQGWLIRFLHSNGASMFFLLVYLHMGRGLYYGSYRSPRSLVWILGVFIFILMMATAFLGYVLPWGQMSFWAATVITNFLTVIPYVGKEIVEWVWGGYSIDNATLNRFFSLHYLLPFIIAVLVLFHLLSLHQYGSSNPTGFKAVRMDKIAFHPYYYTKDAFGFFFFLIIYFFFVFFFPDVLGHSDNYIEANPLVTPSHIVPEWYFLPFYAILRSIPSKTLGILLMFFALVVLFFLPVIDKGIGRSTQFRPVYQKFFWIFVANFLFLAFIGSQAPVFPFVEMGFISTHLYFLLLFLFPISSIFEFNLFTYLRK